MLNRIVYESEHTGLNFFTDGKTAYAKSRHNNRRNGTY